MSVPARVLRNVREVAGAARGDRLERRRVAKRYVHDVLRGVVPYIGVEGEQGLVFTSTADRTVGRHVFTDGDWAPHTLPDALRRAGVDLSGSVFVEVGANVGTTTLAAARVARHVLAFEPEPMNFRLLRANVAGNLLDDRVTTVNAGCSDAAGELRMARSSVNWGDHRVSDTGEVPVDVVRLDDGIRAAGTSLEDVGFLWVDVQGHEAQVLRGAPDLLRLAPPLLVELWPEVLGAECASVAELVHGSYSRVVDMHDGRETDVASAARRWADGSTDLLCLR